MSGTAPDLIAGYLEELYAGLRVPAAEAELPRPRPRTTCARPPR